MPAWLCTYRVQLNQDFDFEDLRELADYLKLLGVSHAYLSPILQSTHGSTHGYDISNATAINEELGGEEAYFQAAQALTRAGIGQLLDVVPNHMSTVTPANSWWWDVLARGPQSSYLRYFDFGWAADVTAFTPFRLPVLEDRYPKVLDAGKIGLSRTVNDLRVVYTNWAFPLASASYPMVLRTVATLANDSRLQAIGEAFAGASETHQELWRVLQSHLSDAANAAAFDDALARLTSLPAQLHEILELQHYRLSYWRTANEEWIYRRFFDINTLVGVRVEQPDVFMARHLREFELVRSGLVEGLRIDHVDGLRDPAAYLSLLRSTLPDCAIWVEKILTGPEELPDQWQIDGTTGYDYLNIVNGLFVDPGSAERFTGTYANFTGETRSFEEILREAKTEVVHGLFGGELADMSQLLVQICQSHASARDWSQRDITSALLEYIVALPVYRSYVRGSEDVPATDVPLISRTAQAAAAKRPEIDAELFDFLRDVLLLRHDGPLEREFSLRLQQVTGPAMAKGAEDTAFYRYNRLVSLNEVGGDPARFGVSLDEYHAWCANTSDRWPRTMLATSTHDTKRGEDARQRLNVLSEMPDLWEKLLGEWSQRTVTNSGVTSPGAATEYLFYQTLIAAWPLDIDRALAYMQKASREAKVETSWTLQNEDFEARLEGFVRAVLSDQAFVESIEQAVAKIERHALANSLAQTLLKLTGPGVPDIYRGSEVMNYSLVDPDNRRPVTFSHIRAALSELADVRLVDLWEQQDAERCKLWLTHKALEVRSRDPEAFLARNSYRALLATGPEADRVVASSRGTDVISVTGRFFSRGPIEANLLLPAGRWLNYCSGQIFEGETSVASLLGGLPVALLERERPS